MIAFAGTPLTITHLRVELIAQTTVRLGQEQAGERLRNALAAVMLRTVCPERDRGVRPTPDHVARCPACWLLAAEVDPGEVRRLYSIVPPLPPRDTIAPGERFAFHLTLFGESIPYLPYFLIALGEMGQTGVGPGRGQFEIRSIAARAPLTGAVEPLLDPVTREVYAPTQATDWATVMAVAEPLADALGGGATLTLRFLTPLRLIADEALVKQPDFGILFQRLLHRIDQLGDQFAGGLGRDPAHLALLQARADQVRLVDARVRWVDLWSWSGRTQKRTPMGGFVGWATYRATDWGPLLPWLLLGQATQVGKLTVKGNGVFEINHPALPGYWTEP